MLFIINEKFEDLNKQIYELNDFNELMKKDYYISKGVK